MPKVFLSFATADLSFIVKLFNRLKRLKVDIWDYSNRQAEIKLGKDVLENLDKHISESDYFIPVISNNSTAEEKVCIQFEVNSAVKNRKQCFPVIIQKRESIKWAGAFELIKNLKNIEIDQEDNADFEEKISMLCESLGVPYEPDIADPHRLPLFKKLENEINSQFDQLRPYQERVKYDDLMMDISEFNFHYSLGQWNESLERIELILNFSRLKLKTKLYWPLIAKGACELQLNLISKAEKTFTEALSNKKVDENAYGGLGQVYFIQNRFEEALAQYKIALSRCPEGMEAEIVYNILLTVVEILNADGQDEKLVTEATRIINNTDYLLKLNWLNHPNNKEKLRTKYLIGLALLKGRNYGKAYTYFTEVYAKEAFYLNSGLSEELDTGIISENLHKKFKEQGFPIPVGIQIIRRSDLNNGHENWIIADGPSIYILRVCLNSISVYYREVSFIINFSELLELIGEPEKALKILESEAVYLNDRLLFHHFANLLIRKGCVKRAGEVYRDHLCQHSFDKQLLTEYAIVLKHLNETEEMKKQCELAISLGKPKDSREFYYHGFAYYLLGEAQLANAYYGDSSSYAAYYSNIV